MTNHFCGGCNRLRIMAGREPEGVPIRPGRGQPPDTVRGGASDDELMDVVGKAVGNKKAKHAGMSDLQKTWRTGPQSALAADAVSGPGRVLSRRPSP